MLRRLKKFKSTRVLQIGSNVNDFTEIETLQKVKNRRFFRIQRGKLKTRQ